jgi:uncharacterized membrane protein YccC
MKYLVALVAFGFLVSFLTRSPRMRRGLQIVLAVLAVYAILKMTGVIEAIAPDRDGVF